MEWQGSKLDTSAFDSFALYPTGRTSFISAILSPLDITPAFYHFAPKKYLFHAMLAGDHFLRHGTIHLQNQNRR